MVTTGLALHEMLGAVRPEHPCTGRSHQRTAGHFAGCRDPEQELPERALPCRPAGRGAHEQKLFSSPVPAVYGTTPYNYLVNFRITQAKELLVLTDHSVSEIAQEVGFGDASNFSTRFAKATGQSPLQYRKRALKPQEAQGEQRFLTFLPELCCMWWWRN